MGGEERRGRISSRVPFMAAKKKKKMRSIICLLQFGLFKLLYAILFLFSIKKEKEKKKKRDICLQKCLVGCFLCSHCSETYNSKTGYMRTLERCIQLFSTLFFLRSV